MELERNAPNSTSLIIMLLILLILTPMVANQNCQSNVYRILHHWKPEVSLDMLATSNDHAYGAKMLLGWKVQVNDRKDGATALMEASKFGHSDVVTMFLAREADVNAAQQHG